MPEEGYERNAIRRSPSQTGFEGQSNAIPEFPRFEMLKFADRPIIDAYTDRYGPYSDFVSGSVLSWDVHQDIRISNCRGNLALMFTDYETNEPFYTFIGTNDVNGTAEDLLQYPSKSDHVSQLKLVPESSAQELDPKRFVVTEDQDHFDYLYDLRHHAAFEGRGLKARRNSLNKFLRKHPLHKAKEFTCNDESTKQRVAALCRIWEENSGERILNEAVAIRRFLDHSESFQHIAIGVDVDNELRGFIVTLLTPPPVAVALFSKTDIRYDGINSMLMQENAKMLLERGYTQINYEQDLGIENLRRSKRSFDPSGFLKKYRVSRV